MHRRLRVSAGARVPASLAVRLLQALFLYVLLAASPLLAQDLELRFLDVGQGDAVLIRNDGRTALIDAGRSGSIVPRLMALGVDSVDLLVASHNHADHIGGAEGVLLRFPVRYYLDNGHPHTTQTQRRVLQQVVARQVTYLQASPRSITLGDATLRIVASPLASAADQNNKSVVVLVERGKFKALLSGDSEAQEINALLAREELPDVDVLKAAHHGSRNGVTPAWLARLKPEVVVISVGENNSYGHPHPFALRYYEAGDRRVLRTDRDGDIIFRVDPEGCYKIETDRSGTLQPIHVGEIGQPEAPPVQQARPQAQPQRACCKICRKGKACGNTCISRSYTCRQPRGCACNG